MRRTQTVEGLILSRRSVSEADRLVTFFTQELGLVQVLAKGVRRIPSRRGGHLEPLTRVRAALSISDDRYFLSGIETVDYLPALRTHVPALLSAQFLARVVRGFLAYEVSHRSVFVAMAQAWELLPVVSADRRNVLEAAVAVLIMGEAGVMPAFSALASAGLVVSEESLTCLRHVAGSPQRVLQMSLSGGESTHLRRVIRLYAERSAFAVH